MTAPSSSRRPCSGRAWGVVVRGSALAALCASAACASVSFTRETETSGRFESSGIALTFFAYDLPKRAIDIARENASDSRQPNMRVEDEWVFPSLGPLDWLLDVVGVRYARVSGRWGFDPETTGNEGAN